MVFFLLSLCVLLPVAVLAASDDASPNPTKEPGLEPILGYITKSWDTLTRSMEECTTVVDPKLAENSVLYLPAEMAMPPQVAEMQKRCHIQVKSLPEKITKPGQINTANWTRRDCSIWNTSMWCRAGGLMRCTDGTATLLCADWCATGELS